MREFFTYGVIILFLGITSAIIHGVILSSQKNAKIRATCVLFEADHINGAGKWRCPDGVIHILPD